MSIRTLMAMAAGGLAMTLATGQLSPLRAQGNASLAADAAIIREVPVSNLLEIRLGDLARKKATQPAVKAFGDRMVTDHSNMYRQWNAVYQQWVAEVGQSGKIEPGLGEARAEELKRMEKVPANQFDREYMTTMIRHHQENVSFFQSSANSAQSPRVRDLLISGLPVLQQHLSLALQVGGQVGAAPAVAVGGQDVPSNVPVANPTLPGGQNPPVAGQNPPTPSQATPVASERERKALKKDVKFVREAIADNTLEVQLAQLAQQKTTNPDVLALARQVISDHTVMQNQWITMASNHGMNLKPGMGRKHRAKVDRLEKTSPAEFDRAYVTMEIQNYQDYVEYFAKEGRATHATQVRHWAQNDLPTLQQHLNDAKRVGNQLGIDVNAALHARTLPAYRR
jgi:putative membrane protein